MRPSHPRGKKMAAFSPPSITCSIQEAGPAKTLGARRAGSTGLMFWGKMWEDGALLVY